MEIHMSIKIVAGSWYSAHVCVCVCLWTNDNQLTMRRLIHLPDDCGITMCPKWKEPHITSYGGDRRVLFGFVCQKKSLVRLADLHPVYCIEVRAATQLSRERRRRRRRNAGNRLAAYRTVLPPPPAAETCYSIKYSCTEYEDYLYFHFTIFHSITDLCNSIFIIT